MKKKQNSVLIVDDTPENLKLLGEIIESEGHKLQVATNGMQALEIANTHQIDLILLDIMMPEMDGYEVCKKLKANPKTKQIPVIFLTALDSLSSESKGFELGAVDYITKPFKLEIVKLRIANHLELNNARQELKKQNEKLEELVAERTQELQEAHERLLSLDSAKYDFLQIIYQNIWAPQNGMVDLCHEILEKFQIDKQKTDIHARLEESQERLFSTINNALLFAGANQGNSMARLGPVRIDTVVEQVMTKLSPVYETKRISLKTNLSPNIVAADIDLLFQALATILHACILFTLPDSRIKVSESQTEENFILIFESNLVDKSVRDQIETLFSQTTGFHKSFLGSQLGLAIPLTDKILKTFKAKLEVKRITNTGVILSLEIPLFKKAKGLKIELGK